jgi:hypothetical protein
MTDQVKMTDMQAIPGAGEHVWPGEKGQDGNMVCALA